MKNIHKKLKRLEKTSGIEQTIYQIAFIEFDGKTKLECKNCPKRELAFKDSITAFFPNENCDCEESAEMRERSRADQEKLKINEKL